MWTNFCDSLFGDVENIALRLKKCHKNEQHLCYVTHIFTKLSQNVCLINTHILIYCNAICNCKLWVFSIFIHCWQTFMSELLCFYQIFIDCVSNQFTHFGMWTCQILLQVMEGSLFKLSLLRIFFTCLKRYNFIKLLQKCRDET